jgi:hypothetical protein
MHALRAASSSRPCAHTHQGKEDQLLIGSDSWTSRSLRLRFTCSQTQPTLSAWRRAGPNNVLFSFRRAVTCLIWAPGGIASEVRERGSGGGKVKARVEGGETSAAPTQEPGTFFAWVNGRGRLTLSKRLFRQRVGEWLGGSGSLGVGGLR